jgi:predicted dithiol-disulfide oxidoreductase (DUF899 family)
MPHLSFPNESAEYRMARNALLEAEMDLRRQLEAVAARRRGARCRRISCSSGSGRISGWSK